MFEKSFRIINHTSFLSFQNGTKIIQKWLNNRPEWVKHRLKRRSGGAKTHVGGDTPKYILHTKKAQGLRPTSRASLGGSRFPSGRGCCSNRTQPAPTMCLGSTNRTALKASSPDTNLVRVTGGPNGTLFGPSPTSMV